MARKRPGTLYLWLAALLILVVLFLFFGYCRSEIPPESREREPVREELTEPAY